RPRPHGSALAGAVIHIPEKSGLPSAALGAGADRLGLPSAARGMPEVRCFTHCASIAVDAHTATATSSTAPVRACTPTLIAPPGVPERPARECRMDVDSTSTSPFPS